MRNPILTELLLPLLTRGGTALTAYMVGSGIATQTLAEQVVAGAIALTLIGLDLIGSHYLRKRVKNANP